MAPYLFIQHTLHYSLRHTHTQREKGMSKDGEEGRTWTQKGGNEWEEKAEMWLHTSSIHLCCLFIMIPSCAVHQLDTDSRIHSVVQQGNGNKKTWKRRFLLPNCRWIMHQSFYPIPTSYALTSCLFKDERLLWERNKKSHFSALSLEMIHAHAMWCFLVFALLILAFNWNFTRRPLVWL